ncbi:DUF4345 domain-containing protein [Zhengella sp. ZM62]|uniref:DUF4345 domain-containing protein n=1 Tax=Zhengella sedimenti TaxID=3390035 RepID=UPI003975DF2A
MDFAFPWPITQGEWLAFWAAAATSLAGLMLLTVPRIALAVLAPDARRNGDAVALVRALPGGFLLGQGGFCILLGSQQMLVMSLSLGWGLAALGSLLALFSRSASRLATVFVLLSSAGLCVLSGAYAFGYVA